MGLDLRANLTGIGAVNCFRLYVISSVNYPSVSIVLHGGGE